MKNLILPAFVMLIGAGTAFASATAKKSVSKVSSHEGYIYTTDVNKPCKPQNLCDEQGTQVCTVGNINPGTPGAVQVFGLNNPNDPEGTRYNSCSIPLFQIPRP